MPKLQSAAALDDYRAKVLSARDPARPCIAVCGGAACDGLDSAAVAAAFAAEIKNQAVEAKVDFRVTGCHGYCSKGPNVIVGPGDICYFEVKPEDVPEIVACAL